MKLQNTVITLALAGAAMLSGAEAAFAGKRTINWNDRSIGNVRVHKSYIHTYRASNGRRYTSVKTSFTLPTCSSRHYLSGTVKQSYSAGGGRLGTRTLYTATRAVNNEGNRLVRSTGGYVDLPDNGTVNISVNLTCKSLAPLRNNIRVPDTSRYDPTKGIFW